MHFLRYFRSLVVILSFAFFGAGALVINYFIFPAINLFAKKEQARRYCCNVIHKTWKFFCILIEKTGSVRIVVSNPEKLKNIRGKIITANHPSFIDIVILIGLLPNTLCMAKKEIKKNIFMGNIVKSLYLINDEDNERLLRESSQILCAGYNIVIFPTGTRTEEGEPLKLHKGAALMALHNHADIIPIHIDCDYKFLAKNHKIYDAGERVVTYTLTVNDEIKIENFTKQDLSKIRLRNRINGEIKEKIQKQPQIDFI